MAYLKDKDFKKYLKIGAVYLQMYHIRGIYLVVYFCDTNCFEGTGSEKQFAKEQTEMSEKQKLLC